MSMKMKLLVLQTVLRQMNMVLMSKQRPQRMMNHQTATTPILPIHPCAQAVTVHPDPLQILLMKTTSLPAVLHCRIAGGAASGASVSAEADSTRAGPPSPAQQHHHA